MKKNIKQVVLAASMTLIVTIACEKKLNVLDQNNPTQESYFKTAQELQNGVNAIYSTLRSGQLVGREWFFVHDMRGGETAAGGVQLEQPRAELLTQPTPTTTNAVMTDLWGGCYRMINRANLILQKAPAVTDNTTLRDRLVGETKFLRAWAYFELVSMWGDVPMYTEPVVTPTGFKGKEPAANIYALIISDLTEAVAKLPSSYTSSDNGRATKWAAYAMLGKVQMQKGDYNSAKTALLAIFNSNQFSLVPNFLWNFDGDLNDGAGITASGHEFNSESIFEVAFYDKGDNNFNWGYNGEGSSNPVSIMRPQEYGIVWGNVIPSDQTLNEFEPNDPRYKFTFFESGDKILTFTGTQAGVALTEPDMNVAQSNHKGDVRKRVYRKYSILDWSNDGFHPDGLNQRLLRYADVLLMLAECEAEAGTPADAAKYINEVRARADVNMPAVTLTSKNQAIEAVMHERGVELAGEEMNNVDILRWRKKGYYPSIRPDPKPGQVDGFPFPASETSANPLLK